MTIEIRLLGGFDVAVDNRPVPTDSWRHRRAAELVKLLALAEGHRLHREKLMDLLWPDLDLEAAAANLRKAVHFARRALGSEDLVRSSSEIVKLGSGDDVEVDAERFEESAEAALAENDADALRNAASLYLGELLPDDRYVSWADDARDRLRLLALRIFKSAGSWERALELEPADEESHRALMEEALARGDRTAAIRQFERLRERLRTDLGMGPDHASVTLYEKALAMEGREPPSPVERIRALIAWGLVHLNSGALDEAERTADEARALAIDANLGNEIGEASALVGIIANMKGRWRDLFKAEFMASVKRSPDISRFVFDAHLCLAEFSLNGPAGHEEIIGYAEELLDAADEADSAHGRALAELLLGEADLYSDRLDLAESHLESSASLHEKAGSSSGRTIALERLAEIALARGDHQRARDLIQEGMALAKDSPLAPHLVVRMHRIALACASDDESLGVLDAADAELMGNVVCPPCSMGFRVGASDALARAGLLEQARRRLDETERIAGMWPGGPWHAAVWESRGILRAAEGESAQAAALFREAADRYAQVGRPRDAARCLAAAR